MITACKGGLDTNAFLNVQDIIAELGVSRSYAYKIIHTLNKELQEQGYLVVSGKVPKLNKKRSQSY